MRPCIEAFAAKGGARGERVAYIHYLTRCSNDKLQRRRRCPAYFLKGHAATSRFLHGDSRFPMTDGRRPEESRLLRGKREIEAARVEAEAWIRL